jgi:hypothetical protein
MEMNEVEEFTGMDMFLLGLGAVFLGVFLLIVCGTL